MPTSPRCARSSTRDDLGDEDRFHLQFALGKALEDDEAVRAERSSTTQRGNALRRATVDYDAEKTHEHVARSQGAVHAASSSPSARGYGDAGARSDLHRRPAALRLDPDRADPGQPSPGRGHDGAARHRLASRVSSAAQGARATGVAYPDVLGRSRRRTSSTRCGEEYLDAHAHPAQARPAVLHRQDAEQLRCISA